MRYKIYASHIKKIQKFLFFLLFTYFQVCCNRINPDQQTDKSVFTYHLEKKILDAVDTFNLSKISNSILYVKLKTQDSYTISKIEEVEIDDSLIFVFEKYEGIFIYNLKGDLLNFIRKDESHLLKRPIYFDLDKNRNHILIYDDELRKLLFFNYATDFIKEIKLNKEYFQYFTPYYDDRVLAYTMHPFTQYNRGYNMALLLGSGEINERFLQRKELSPEKNTIAIAINRLYNYRDTLSLWQFYYDTIYRILPDAVMKPKYSFSLGSLKVPTNIFYNVKDANESQKYASIRDVLETQTYFFIKVLSNAKVKHIIIDKISNDICCIGNSKIENDVDGIIDFWPAGAINDSILYMVIHPLEILQSMELSHNVKAVHPEFYSSLNCASVYDNPWLIILTLH